MNISADKLGSKDMIIAYVLLLLPIYPLRINQLLQSYGPYGGGEK